jgi:predicted transcriptional regulator
MQFTKFLAYYAIFFLFPLGLLLTRLWNIEKQNRRTADALEKIAKSLEAKPLKLDEVIDLEDRL